MIGSARAKRREGDGHSSEHAPNPEINNTGAYGRVSIELDVTSLAFNTILESGKINDIEVRATTDRSGTARGSGFQDAAARGSDRFHVPTKPARPLGSQMPRCGPRATGRNQRGRRFVHRASNHERAGRAHVVGL